MKLRTISIVTPSLNQVKYIEQTIKSVLDQSGDFYIDYIISDGASTDGSVEIIKKYADLIKNKKYPIKCRGIEFRWWSEEDKGQSDAINKGFKLAKGEILAWINSDDWYEKDTFSLIVNEFDNNKEVDLVYGNCFEVLDTGVVKKGEALQSDFEMNIKQGCIIAQPAAFFTKRVIDKVGMLDEDFHYAMDYDLWLRILKESKAKFVEKDLAYFRVWENSKTSTKANEFVKEENLIRAKYGGSKINPGSIHRFRQKFKIFDVIKHKLPGVYIFFKKLVYKTINLNNKS